MNGLVHRIWISDRLRCCLIVNGPIHCVFRWFQCLFFRGGSLTLLVFVPVTVIVIIAAARCSCTLAKMYRMPSFPSFTTMNTICSLHLTALAFFNGPVMYGCQKSVLSVCNVQLISVEESASLIMDSAHASSSLEVRCPTKAVALLVTS